MGSLQVPVHTMSARLHIPGPVEVSPKTFAAMTRPMMGHRSKDFQNLYASLQPALRGLFGTERPVYLSTSSAWGVMEGAIRNLVKTKVLCCMCGAFSDKWLDVSRRCGLRADALQVEWGRPITPDLLDTKLAEGGYDTVTLIHNETSTGVMSPLADLCAVIKKYPDVMLIVDTVSSFSVVPVPMDELGIDVLLTGSQKALAMPPGLALFAVSEHALARAATVEGRGYYFDFVEFEKNAQNNMTPSTPSIALIYALQSKLEDIAAEGVSARHARHAHLNDTVAGWVRRNGFEFFAPVGCRSKSLTCVKNNRNIDVAAFVKCLREKHDLIIDGGYGKIKGATFRLSNMGDETDETIARLLAGLDAALAEVAP